jgi:hypothetical protein
MRTLTVKPILNPPSMSSSKSDSGLSSSSSDGYKTDQSKKPEIDILSPVESNDTKDNGVSMSQRELAMAKEMANNSIIANSTSYSEGEDKNDSFYHLLYRFYCAEHNVSCTHA